MSSEPPRVPVTALVGVYDADGGLVGELRYVAGHLLGRLECALCDITHGPLRRKQDFDELRERLGVPFDVVHRNERSAEVAAATGDALPCVVAVTGDGPVVVMDRVALETCRGDVAAFDGSLRRSLAARGFELVDRASSDGRDR